MSTIEVESERLTDLQACDQQGLASDRNGNGEIVVPKRIDHGTLNIKTSAEGSMAAQNRRVGRPRKYDYDLAAQYLEDKKRVGPDFNQVAWCAGHSPVICPRTLRRYLAQDRKQKGTSNSGRTHASQNEFEDDA